MAQHDDVQKMAELDLTSSVDTTEVDKAASVNTLGSVRLRDARTHEIILVPQPSSDPNDPLNWSKAYRYYQAIIVCLAMVMCNFLSAGPSVAIVETTTDFFGSDAAGWDANVSKIAFLFTATALLQGLGNLIWMPLIVKYGRRPMYLASFSIYLVSAIWSGAASGYADALVARTIMGFAAGSGECLAPLTISDIFFLHERGAIMAWYTASLNFGVSLGIICSGLIVMNHDWRYIYWVGTALIGTLLILVFFTMPETSYVRSSMREPEQHLKKAEKANDSVSQADSDVPTKHGYLHVLRIYHSTLTSESLWTLFQRPFAVLLLPPVLWATLVMSVTIGFLVAITTNFANAYSTLYNFEAWQSGLCFISGLIGSAIGIFFGGHVSDQIANHFTKKNGGVREPEFRLPAISIGLITTPLALILYGAGMQNSWHWVMPTIAMGLLNFSIAQATNVSLVYVVDAYRPVAGEIVVAQLAFKSAFGFLLSFYTNPWIEQSGYQSAFGEMAGISATVLIGWVPLFLYGKRIRQASLEWPIIKNAVRWSADREVGE